MNRHIRKLVDYAQSSKDPAVRVAAEAILRNPIRSPASGLKPKLDTRPERKRWKAAQTAEIRAKVMERAQGRCERCHEFMRPYHLYLHHLLPGSGKRLQQQSVETTIAVCLDCHQWAHGNPKIAREWAADFMSKHPETP